MLMTKEALKSPSFSCVIFPENYQSFYDKDKIRLPYGTIENPKYHAKFVEKFEATCWPKKTELLPQILT